MDNTYVQAAMWIFAGLLMILFWRAAQAAGGAVERCEQAPCLIGQAARRLPRTEFRASGSED